MSYLQIDLKVIEVHAPMVARASELSLPHVIGSLNLLWHRCWSTKTDTITRVGLAGIFGPIGLDMAIAAMVDTGLLESLESGWRVRGADKYLRIDEARSRGGKAASGNLRRGKSLPGSSREAAGEQPETSRETPPADSRPLHRDTETPRHREETTAPAARSPRETDALCDDFKVIVGEAYVFQAAKDGAAFAKLRKQFSLEEIRARWRTGLKAKRGTWHEVRTVAQLASKWNDLAGGAPTDTTGDWRSREDHSKPFFEGVDT